MFGLCLLFLNRKAVWSKEHIFPNFCCDVEDPLRCVVQNSELLHTYAHAGARRVRKVSRLCFVRALNWERQPTKI
jgi:hypothetical protein